MFRSALFVLLSCLLLSSTAFAALSSSSGSRLSSSSSYASSSPATSAYASAYASTSTPATSAPSNGSANASSSTGASNGSYISSSSSASTVLTTPPGSLVVYLTLDIGNPPNASTLNSSSVFIIDLTLDLCVNVAAAINLPGVNATTICPFLIVTNFDGYVIAQVTISSRRLLQANYISFVLLPTITSVGAISLTAVSTSLKAASAAGTLTATHLQNSGLFGNVTIPAQPLTTTIYEPISSSTGVGSSNGAFGNAAAMGSVALALLVAAVSLIVA